MVRLLLWYIAGLLFVGLAARAECFRSVGGAATQVGLRDELGFRLEGISRDAFGGRRWAEVRSCKYPERPSVLVALEDRASSEIHPHDDGRTSAAEPRHALVTAGSRVTVVSVDSVVRLEMSGIAVESAAAGERVRVRLVTEGQAGERIAFGVVRGAALVEMMR